MPDLGIFGWIIIGLLAGALAGAFVPGRQRYGCLGTMAIGIIGGLVGGWLWVNVLNQDPASGLARRPRHRHARHRRSIILLLRSMSRGD